MRKPRKNYTAVEKVAILWRHLIDPVPASDLCDEHPLSPTLFHLWQKQFFENGPAAFERRGGAADGGPSPRCVDFPTNGERLEKSVSSM